MFFGIFSVGSNELCALGSSGLGPYSLAGAICARALTLSRPITTPRMQQGDTVSADIGFIVPSVGECAAIGAHFAGRSVDARAAVHAMFDAFVAAESTVGLAHRPAETDEFATRLERYSRLQTQHALRAKAG